MFFIILSVYLNILSGDVKVKSEGVWKDGFPEMELKEGDTVNVIDGKAEIIYDDFTIIVADSGTVIAINSSGNQNRIYLKIGKIWSKISKLISGKVFEIENPVCVAGVRGTEFIVSYSEDSSDIEVLEGEVEVKEKMTNKMVMLKRLQRIRVRRKILGKIQNIDEARFIHWYRWDKKDAEKIIEKIKERKERREIYLERLEILQRRLKDKDIENRIKQLNEEGLKDEDLIKLRAEFLIKRIEENISKMELKIQEGRNLANQIRADGERLRNLIRKKEIKEAKALLIKIEQELIILKLKGKEIQIISEKIRIDKEKLDELLKAVKNKKSMKELSKRLQKTIKEAERMLEKIKRWKEEYGIFEKKLEEIKKKFLNR